MPPHPPMIKNSHFLTFFAMLSSSVEIDGSLGDSDSLKEPGSKKRYTIFYSLILFIKQNFILMKGKNKDSTHVAT